MRLIFSLIAFILVSPAFAQNTLGIAAIVNNDIITTADVEGRVMLGLQGANIKPDAETLKEIRRQALDSLIDEQIRLQEASRLGVTPSKEEVADAFAKLAGQNGLTPEQFKKVLNEKPGLYTSLTRQMKTQAAWGNVVKRKIRPQINITEAEITAYLQGKEKNPAKVEYNVAEIFLKNTPSNQKLAQQLVAQIRSGKQRFSALGRQFSQGLEASKGGALGWIEERRLEKTLDDALAGLKVGDISDPITTLRGLHILMLRDKRDILATKEAGQRINLKQIVAPLPPNPSPDWVKQAETQVRQLKNSIKSCDDMTKKIDTIKSPLSRDLGESRFADLPAPVQKAVKNLPIGTLSDPVQASDGIAVFMVCGRTEGSEELARNDAANALGVERLNRLQYRYYRDLRAAAYVDIRQN